MENKDRVPTHEWFSSSNWEEAVSLDRGFILGVGYCYLKQLKSVFLGHQKPYYFFQTKWGRCGTTFLFSALRPDAIIVPSAWANACMVGRNKPDVLFRIWKEILLNLASMNVPLMMVDMPAAWHISNIEADLGREEFELFKSERRALYFNAVVKPCLETNPNIEYVDLQDFLPYDSKLIKENSEEINRVQSPWHLTQKLMNCVGDHFLLFTQEKYEKQTFLEEVIKLNSEC